PVNVRNLLPSIDAYRLTMSFSSYEVDEIINRTGSLVWEGEMAVAGERNRPVTTAIPLKDMLHEKGPGIYLAVAERTDLMQDQYAEPATNWVLVSDLGLAAYKGTDGLTVDVRSLADGNAGPSTRFCIPIAAFTGPVKWSSWSRWCATTRPMRCPVCRSACGCCGRTGSRSKNGSRQGIGWAPIDKALPCRAMPALAP